MDKERYSMEDMNYMKKVTFEMPAEAHRELKTYCVRMGEPMGEWIMHEVMAALMRLRESNSK